MRVIDSERTGCGRRSSRTRRLAVAAEVAAGGVGEPAARQRPVARHRRDRGERAQRHPAAGVALDAHRGPDRGRPRRREPLAERDDPLHRQVADLGDPLGRERGDPLAVGVPADAALAQERLVVRAAADDLVHQAERQRGVGAGPRREVLVGLRGAARAHRVDHHEVRALPARGDDELPDVVVARERVRAPEQDEPRVRERLGIHPAVGARREAQPLAAGDRADRHLVLARAEDVPQPRARAALQTLQVAERAGPLERPDRLAAVALADGEQPLGDLAERVVPGDPLEPPLALGADRRSGCSSRSGVRVWSR